MGIARRCRYLTRTAATAHSNTRRTAGHVPPLDLRSSGHCESAPSSSSSSPTPPSALAVPRWSAEATMQRNKYISTIPPDTYRFITLSPSFSCVQSRPPHTQATLPSSSNKTSHINVITRCMHEDRWLPSPQHCNNVVSTYMQDYSTATAATAALKNVTSPMTAPPKVIGVAPPLSGFFVVVVGAAPPIENLNATPFVSSEQYP